MILKELVWLLNKYQPTWRFDDSFTVSMPHHEDRLGPALKEKNHFSWILVVSKGRKGKKKKKMGLASPQAAQAHVSEASCGVWFVVKLHEEPLEIWTRYKE